MGLTLSLRWGLSCERWRPVVSSGLWGRICSTRATVRLILPPKSPPNLSFPSVAPTLTHAPVIPVLPENAFSQRSPVWPGLAWIHCPPSRVTFLEQMSELVALLKASDGSEGCVQPRNGQT